ncbi:hypothetical protein KVR01_007371 [Diaporthe batatas]|uniref:uncharacterized protein n=1 Tax=Diaporthe batatas TaxID=748121 RepID=UPI001D050027|nr:uncharacterized protein KVR01_007371 [Diaporthe batatas]KAG8162893.1 hypothetical protein KVR01_007371 [Diaporthe batatas]
MAYPPRSQVGPAMNSTAAEIGPLMEEQIPAPAAHVNKRDIVHFDMDHQNVFMLDEEDRRPIPFFQVADFGLSHTPDETRSDIPRAGPPYNMAQKVEIWGNRVLGKDGWNVPEQFTTDWDKDAQIQNIWTYGSEVEQQIYRDVYGDGLCGLVAKCLAVRPSDRPTLQELRTSLDFLKPAGLTDTDRAWATRFFGLPPAPRTTPLAEALG